ncbi:MAG TPA: extracellular solute-binding protein [Acidimicrobiia bacterium]|nr:extracellular solute-binding protein [Acidimicrobiia bacterium]
MRSIRLVVVVALLAGLVGACGGGGGRAVPALGWYVNPDNGGQAELAAACTAASGGRYRITVSTLPNDASGQREQLVRRLAAKDRSIALMSLDPPFVAEFADAGFLRPFTPGESAGLTAGVLGGAVDAATWQGRLVAAPFWANTQLLWFRKSAAARSGLDPAAGPVTWDDVIGAAERTGATVEVQGGRYEGYMVLISALVASAGGVVLEHPEAGRDAKPALDSPSGHRAAGIIARLAHSRAADPGLATADEESGRAAFQGDRGGFMANWAYVYGAASEAVASGALGRAVLDDIAWARWPRVDAGRPSRPPLGGIDLGVSAYTRHPALAVDAVRCLTTADSQRRYMLKSKNPAARASVYDEPEVRKAFPMADLIRESIGDAGPRPKTPYYTDVSAAVTRTFHPPASVNPATTPAAADRLVRGVLHDRVLL